MREEMQEWKRISEREVRLSDFLIVLLQKSWLILSCMIIFAILVTVYKYESDRQSYNIQHNSEYKAAEKIKEELTKEEQEAVEKATEIESQIIEKQKYKLESILMNINPYKKNQVSLQYYVDTDYTIDFTSQVKKDYTSDLLEAYTTYIQNGGISNYLYDKTKWEGEKGSIGELMEFYMSEASFTVKITGEDEKSAKELADKIESALKEYQGLLEENIGVHKLNLIDRYDSIVVDKQLEEKQDNFNRVIINLKKEYSLLVKDFTDNQLLALEGEADSKQDKLVKPTVSKKYIFWGAILGLLLSSVCIGFCYIFSNKLNSSQVVEEMYGLRLFGELSVKDNQKGGLKYLLNRLKDRIQGKEQWTKEEQKELILANITMTCKKANINQLFIATSLPTNEKRMQLVQILLEGIQEAGIEVIFGESIIRSAKSFRQMAEIAKVILVEEVGTTTYFMLEKELKLCAGQKAEVLGVVTIADL